MNNVDTVELFENFFSVRRCRISMNYFACFFAEIDVVFFYTRLQHMLGKLDVGIFFWQILTKNHLVHAVNSSKVMHQTWTIYSLPDRNNRLVEQSHCVYRIPSAEGLTLHGKC
jgi:hypothetical protein